MATGSKAAFESATKNGVLVIDVAEGACQDGCGETVAKGRKFRQGHDARLRGMLNQAHRSGTPVKLNGKQTTAEAVLTAHGLPMPAERKPRVRKSTAAKKTTAKKSTAKRGTSRKAATPAAS